MYKQVVFIHDLCAVGPRDPVRDSSRHGSSLFVPFTSGTSTHELYFFHEYRKPSLDFVRQGPLGPESRVRVKGPFRGP